MNELRPVLAQTIAWCNNQDFRSDPVNSLRTRELKPVSFTYAETLAQRQALVEALAEKRLRLMRSAGRFRPLPARHLAGGRLLLYDPDRNTYDSGALVESYGYFDWDNLPPWDTWVSYLRDEARERAARKDSEPGGSFLGYLVSWVPSPLVEQADAGVRGNADGCLMWARDLDSPLARKLAAIEESSPGGKLSVYRRLAARLTGAHREAG